MTVLLGAHPLVHVVNEPDNRNLDLLGWLGTGRVGAVPSLAVGSPAPDYHRMWRLAFAGGWPTSGVLGKAVATARAVAASERVPTRIRTAALRGAARMAGRRPRLSAVVLVKSVAAQLSLEWLVAEFEPALLVVWRHPLNLVASWQQLGWDHAEVVGNRPAVRARFESSAVWPPPARGHAAVAWSACAQSVVLLEAAARLPGALLLNHEETARNPAEAVDRALTHVGLGTVAAVEEAIERSNRPGEGWVAQRLRADEPDRWRSRLAPGIVQEVKETIERFGAESEVARTLWHGAGTGC